MHSGGFCSALPADDKYSLVYLPPLGGVLTGLAFGGSDFSFSGLSLLSDFPGKKNWKV
jgi:hypothetical protein